MATRFLVARLAARSLSTAVSHSPISRVSLFSNSRAFATAAAATRSTNALACVAVLSLGTSVAFATSPEQQNLTKEQIDAVSEAIRELLDNEEEGNLGPTLVRLAWHCSGTYDKHSQTGGSEGAKMRFKPESHHGANAGLHVARDALEPIKILFSHISYADLWTLAGAVAIEHMGGPKILWRPGRHDATSGESCTPDGRLPDPDKGQIAATIRHVRSIFNRQGFQDREIVALVGAHALGRCHTDRSGYTGPWTRAPTTFSNLYFTELLENTWTVKLWEGPDQFEDPTGDLMMLPSDMALLWDKDFRKYVVEFAKDEDSFFKAFATAFQKLEENGVKSFQSNTASSNKPWYQLW